MEGQCNTSICHSLPSTPGGSSLLQDLVFCCSFVPGVTGNLKEIIISTMSEIKRQCKLKNRCQHTINVQQDSAASCLCFVAICCIKASGSLLPYMPCCAMPCCAAVSCCAAMSCCAMLCYAMPCCATFSKLRACRHDVQLCCAAVPCHAMPCHVMPCNAVQVCSQTSRASAIQGILHSLTLTRCRSAVSFLCAALPFDIGWLYA